MYMSTCVHAQSLGRVWLFATPWTVAHQALLLMGLYQQKYWSELLFPLPGDLPNHYENKIFNVLVVLFLSARIFFEKNWDINVRKC